MNDDWQWLSVAQMAQLFNITPRAFNARVDENGWRAPEQRHSRANPNGLWRRRSGHGGGYEYHYRLLPARLAAAHQAKHQPKPEDPTEDRKARKAALARDDAWAFYDRLPDSRKDAAKAKLAILQQIVERERQGTGKEEAVTEIAKQHAVGRSTVHTWFDKVAGVAHEDWLPYLVDHRGGRQPSAEMTPEAWEAFKADFLRAEEPTAAECYNRLKDAAKVHGWTLPSLKTVQRRIDRDIDPRVLVRERKGPEEYDRLYPAQRRDRSVFHALQAINYDGHKLDLHVNWPGVKGPTRAFLLGFQDLLSGMVVGWRLDISENAYAFRLAYGDVIETHGVPEIVYSDNTMAAAAKENTGGSRFRRRFKIKEDDQVGIFKIIGSDIRFTKPAHGQSKPIERAFGTLSRYISKAPECAGAYTGNSPENKPHNYGSAAIDLANLIPIVEREIHRFNHDPDLNQANGKGRSRFEIFSESYGKSLIRTADGLPLEKRRMLRLAAEGLTCRQPSGEIHLHDNRYWHERLIGLIGKKVVVRFDPDRLHQPVHVYRLDGAFVCTAECIDDVGFNDAAAAKRHGDALKAHRRAGRALVEAQKKLGIRDVAALMPEPEDVSPPEAKVVRPFAFGNAAVQQQAVELADEEADAFMQNFKRGVQLRLVTDE